MQIPRSRITTIVFAFVIVLLAGRRHAAADFVMSVAGEFQSFKSFSVQFDGTTTVNDALPPLFDVDQLNGGSFTATFSFPSVDPLPSGNFANYPFGTGFGLTYTLFDAGGDVIHQGSNPSDAGALVFDNAGPPTPPPPPFDGVTMFSFVNDVSGLVLPEPLYSPVPDVFAVQSALGFNGEVSGSTNYLTGLAIPIDPATYLNFPNRTFNTGMTFGDGDWKNAVAPFQYVETSLSYTITSVSIVPGPASLMVVMAGLGIARRRRRGLAERR